MRVKLIVSQSNAIASRFDSPKETQKKKRKKKGVKNYSKARIPVPAHLISFDGKRKIFKEEKNKSFRILR